MRGAGCTYNDIVDRDIDARVARTRGRPLPSGAISVTRRVDISRISMRARPHQCCSHFNLFTILLGASSLVLVAIYPFMKRITWWPQAWLGLTFNWGTLVGFAAKTGHLSMPAFLLYAACFFWTLGYDTIYAHQDKDDDALIGVKSTARLFGTQSKLWIALFYLAALMLFLGAVAGSPRDLVIPFWSSAQADIFCGRSGVSTSASRACASGFSAPIATQAGSSPLAAISLPHGCTVRFDLGHPGSYFVPAC